MLRLDLLRHGATVESGCYHGSTDVALSEDGLRQMREATRDGGWDGIVSSPLQRCANFAAQLAAQLDLPLTLDARLREMHFGLWEGRRVAELQAQEPQALGRFWSNPLRHAPVDAEPLAELRARVLDCCAALLLMPARRLLLVTHGGPMRVLLARAQARPLANLLEIDVPHASRHALRASRDDEGALQLQYASATDCA